MNNTKRQSGLNELWNELWEENEMNENIEELIGQLTGKESDNEEENKMNKNNNVEGNFVNPEEENEMNNEMNNNESVIETCFDEIGIDNEISIMADEEWNETVKETCFDNEWEDERATMSDEEWNFWREEDRIRDEKNRKRDLERIKADLEEINERKERRKMAIKSVEIRKEALKSFKKSAALAKQRQVADEQILKNKTDIDNYFMSVDADTKDNYEEENEMNTNNNVAGFNELWEEITVEAETKEDSFDASSLIHKGNILIACPSSLYAYKEAIVLLRDVEGAIDETGNYTTKLSLESIKDGLMNLIANYEADTDMSGTTNKEKQPNKSILADKVAGFKEVTAEKVSVLKEITSEKVSQAKTAIDNVDENNEYYQKGVEVTEKAKAKYNKVLGDVFNRLKL